jgi:hypothetical protein
MNHPVHDLLALPRLDGSACKMGKPGTSRDSVGQPNVDISALATR